MRVPAAIRVFVAHMCCGSCPRARRSLTLHLQVEVLFGGVSVLQDTALTSIVATEVGGWRLGLSLVHSRGARVSPSNLSRPPRHAILLATA